MSDLTECPYYDEDHPELCSGSVRVRAEDYDYETGDCVWHYACDSHDREATG